MTNVLNVGVTHHGNSNLKKWWKNTSTNMKIFVITPIVTNHCHVPQLDDDLILHMSFPLILSSWKWMSMLTSFTTENVSVSAY